VGIEQPPDATLLHPVASLAGARLGQLGKKGLGVKA
jgi:hypothetical protein